MVEMRTYEKLYARSVQGYSYTWDTTYTKILTADDFGSYAIHTEIITNTGGYPTYNSQTVDFIFPFKYDNEMLIDGTARGNCRVQLRPSSWTNFFVYFDINVLARDNSGSDRTLASVTTGTINTSASSYTFVDIPFFVDIVKGEIKSNEKLILQVTIYVAGSISGIPVTLEAGSGAETFIEIPVVT